MNIAIFVLLCIISRLTRRYHNLSAAFVIHVNSIIICFLIEHINRTIAISLQYNYLNKS